MLKFIFLVLALCGSQAFGQTCANYNSCVRNMTNLEVTLNKFIVGVEGDLINATRRLNIAVKEFEEKVANGPEECKYLNTNIRRTLLYSCGVQAIGVGDEINPTKKYLESLPEDIFTANISNKQKQKYCRLFVKYYNFTCKGLTDGLEQLRECDVDEQVQIFTDIWLRCGGNFKE